MVMLLLGLTVYNCQQPHLQARDEEMPPGKAGEYTPAPNVTLSTPTKGLQAALNHPAAGMDTVSNKKTPGSGATRMLSPRKRSAEALSHDTEEKKKSPTASAQPGSRVASMTPGRSIAASMTQASQKSAAMAISPVHATRALTKAERKNAGMIPEDTKDVMKKTANEEVQKASADLKRWFKEFAEAVDDEEVLSLGDTSEAIPRLVQEGKGKEYLNKSMKLVINEVGWEPDCTPLHYAAAKGNPQAVEALVREPEVVIDARTEENGTTPLQFAAYDGHLRAAERLISAYKERGKIKEIDARDKEGTSALQYAALGPRGGMNRDVAELLVAQGANPTQLSDNISPLVCLSASAGNFSMVEYWIEEIAHTGRFSSDEDKDFIKRGIKLARRNRHTDIVIILQDYYKDL
jgi:hypothetical protein